MSTIGPSITGLVVCILVLGAIVVVYLIVNKPSCPVIPPAPLSQLTLQEQLSQAEAQFRAGHKYSNIYDSHLGFSDNKTILLSLNENKTVCKAVCDENSNCFAFQMNPTGTSCDLLGNAVAISNTYSFTDPGWNLYMYGSVLQHKKFDTVYPGEQMSGSKLGDTMPDVTTSHVCGMLCTSNVTCQAFSVGPQGCELFTNSESTLIPVQGYETYKVKNADSVSSTF